MSYTPTNWKAGDTVTSAKLNKIEQGIASAGGANILVANCNLDSSNTSGDPPGGTRSAASTTIPSLDKTLGEILNADFVIVKMIQNNTLGYGYITNIQYSEEGQIYDIIVFTGLSQPIAFIAQNESDYPTFDAWDSDNDGSDDNGDDSGNTPVLL